RPRPARRALAERRGRGPPQHLDPALCAPQRRPRRAHRRHGVLVHRPGGENTMTDQATAAPAAPAPPAARRGTLAAYARLAKLDIYDYYIGLPLVWAMLLPAVRWEPATLGLLALILIAEVAVVAAMVACDDVTGYRDGSDAANYGSDAARRRLARKPLVAGTLTEAQALRFARAATALSVLLWALVLLAAPHRPWWAVALAALCLVASVQYSWGLKISYRGFQEIFLIGLGIGWVLVPYGLLTGEASGFAVVQA